MGRTVQFGVSPEVADRVPEFQLQKKGLHSPDLGNFVNSEHKVLDRWCATRMGERVSAVSMVTACSPLRNRFLLLITKGPGLAR